MDWLPVQNLNRTSKTSGLHVDLTMSCMGNDVEFGLKNDIRCVYWTTMKGFGGVALPNKRLPDRKCSKICATAKEMLICDRSLLDTSKCFAVRWIQGGAVVGVLPFKPDKLLGVERLAALLMYANQLVKNDGN